MPDQQASQSNIERWPAWRVLDCRGLGAHSSWSFGNPPSHFAADEVETVVFVRESQLAGAVDALAAIRSWCMAGSNAEEPRNVLGQIVGLVDTTLHDARGR